MKRDLKLIPFRPSKPLAATTALPIVLQAGVRGRFNGPIQPSSQSMKLPRNAQLWYPGLIRGRIDRWINPGPEPTHVWLTFGDHFEPRWLNADLATARSRVAAWESAWPAIAERYRDCRGAPGRYTFFYPEEEYHPDLLEPLARMARNGCADVEVHIHHDGEGEANFVGRMIDFIAKLTSQHGLLRERDGRPAFGFIHGNWALDNARPDGRWCGLNNELTLLRQLGCYADFTLPAAPDPCQTTRVNSIYWAVDDPRKPKSHDDGTPATPGGTPPASSLLMIQGPLGLRWPRDRWPRPALEVGELVANDPVTADRVRAWLRLAPRIGEHVFLKLFAHGAYEKNATALLEHDLEAALAMIHSECSDRGWQVVHATAWDAFRAVEAVVARQDPLRAID